MDFHKPEILSPSNLYQVVAECDNLIQNQQYNYLANSTNWRVKSLVAKNTLIWNVQYFRIGKT